MIESKKESVSPTRFAVLAAAMVLGGAGVPWAHAAPVTLAQYNFNDGTHGGTTTAAVSDANDAAAVAGLGVSAITPSTTSGFFLYDDSLSSYRVTAGSDDDLTWYTNASLFPSQGVDDTKYLEFTLTPDAGDSLTLDTLTAKLGVSKNTGSPSGDNSWHFAVYTSLDGYATPLGTLDSSTISWGDSGGRSPTWTTPALNLSSLGAVTGPITIRLEFSKDNVSTSDLKHMIVDTLSITGELDQSQSIPEPAAAFTGLAMAGAALAMRRRPRRG